MALNRGVIYGNKRLMRASRAFHPRLFAEASPPFIAASRRIAAATRLRILPAERENVCATAEEAPRTGRSSDGRAKNCRTRAPGASSPSNADSLRRQGRADLVAARSASISAATDARSSSSAARRSTRTASFSASIADLAGPCIAFSGVEDLSRLELLASGRRAQDRGQR